MLMFLVKLLLRTLPPLSDCPFLPKFVEAVTEVFTQAYLLRLNFDPIVTLRCLPVLNPGLTPEVIPGLFL